MNVQTDLKQQCKFKLLWMFLFPVLAEHDPSVGSQMASILPAWLCK